jgi:hybrid polyketide synthase/nonribosomal peptide synthetase ACE1
MGSRILKLLTEDDRVALIHCVALREHTDNSPRTLAIESPKLRLHAGDFSQPRLGLEQREFDTLAKTAGLIVHSGANRSFWDYFDNLRGPNVDSTKTLVDMASTHRIPIHFVSSGGVHLLRGNTDTCSYPTESVAAFPPPTDGSNGYIASKWVSEVYLENAVKELGIPVHIHRFVPADATTKSAPPIELLEELQHLAVRLKALPAPSGWVGTFDLSPADGLAAELVENVLDNSAVEGSGSIPHFVHYVSKIKLSMDSVAEYMGMFQETGEEGSAVGEKFERLPPLQWAGKAKKEGLSWHFTSTDFVAMGGVEGVGLRR